VGLSLSLSLPWKADTPGLNVQAAIAAMQGTSPGLLHPLPIWRPPLSVPLARARGATPPPDPGGGGPGISIDREGGGSKGRFSTGIRARLFHSHLPRSVLIR